MVKRLSFHLDHREGLNLGIQRHPERTAIVVRVFCLFIDDSHFVFLVLHVYIYSLIWAYSSRHFTRLTFRTGDLQVARRKGD